MSLVDDLVWLVDVPSPTGAEQVLRDSVAERLDGLGPRVVGNSVVVGPSGEIVAACTTVGDELAVARCDLGLCGSYKTTTFDFARHREPEQYRMIVERKGAVPPPE